MDGGRERVRKKGAHTNKSRRRQEIKRIYPRSFG